MRKNTPAVKRVALRRQIRMELRLRGVYAEDLMDGFLRDKDLHELRAIRNHLVK